MNPADVLKAIRDYGINAILVIAVIWMNNRVSDVEDKLYDCFQNRIEDRSRDLYPIQQQIIKSEAVLPERLKIIKG